MEDLLLSAPIDFETSATSAPLNAAAAASSGQGGKRCRINAYTGGPIRQPWNDEDIYVDLQGMSWPQKSLPLCIDHNTTIDGLLGSTTSVQIDAAAGLVVDGFLNGRGDACKKLLAQAEAGVEFQASIGAVALAGQRVRQGEMAVVNGRQVDGPALIVRKSRLREISIVVNGADDQTVTKIAARAASTREPSMSKPLDTGAANEPAAQTPAAPAPAPAPAGDATPVNAPVAASATPAPTPAAPAISAEDSLVEKIVARLTATGNEAALQGIRAQRPQAPAVHIPGAPEFSSNVLQAAACMAGRLPNVEKVFDEKTLEAAHKQWRGGISLTEMLLAAAQANGYSGRATFRDTAVAGQILRAAWASHDIADILSATVNKFLLAGFMGTDNTCMLIAARRAVTDFKKVTSYRLTGGFKFEEMSGKNEFQMAKAGNVKYENAARTYGIMTNVSREQLINDDLGALTTMPQMIGRGAALKRNEVFWKTFLDNSSIFSSGNKNYVSGASSKLDVDGITAIEQLYLDQTDYDGYPLGVSPEILLVPTALNVKARSFMSSAEVRDTTSNKSYAVSNPHAGKYQPITTPYLSNASFTGNSSTAYYLLANPEVFPLIEFAYLNGMEQPTVEQAEADFAMLGIQMRGFFDFGVAWVEPRAGAKSAGQ